MLEIRYLSGTQLVDIHRSQSIQGVSGKHLKERNEVLMSVSVKPFSQVVEPPQELPLSSWPV
jgi:hypothetical protein